jgi:hypothetical protein
MIDDILDALIAAMETDTNLSEIKKYNKVEGMLAGMSSTVSIWVPQQKFSEYDSNMDEVELEIHIGVSIHDIDVERGEERIRALAEEIRLLLVSDQETLGGLIDSSFFTKWDFASVSTEKQLMLHLAEGIWEVKYYDSRIRDISSEQTDEIDINENIITDEIS